MIPTESGLYITNYYGERFKINYDFSIVWNVNYIDTYSWAMAISEDESFLIASGHLNTNVVLLKLDSTDGSLINSVYTSERDYYWYVHIKGD